MSIAKALLGAQTSTGAVVPRVADSRIAAKCAVPSAAARPNQADASVRGRKIMIVDDEEYNILVLCKYLKGAGYQNIVHTDDSRQAMELICAVRPDILLLDIMMPHVSGLEILSAISGMPALDKFPVLVLFIQHRSGCETVGVGTWSHRLSGQTD